MRILLIEDDRELGTLVKKFLVKQKYECEVAYL